ncbi:MAG: S53 family peptidase [Thermoplasmata archaeon]
MSCSVRAPRNGRFGVTVSVLLAALLLLPAATFATNPPGGHSGAPPVGSPTTSPASFAERAGYVASVGDQVPNSVLATADTRVVVSFVPSAPGFYDPPPPGARPMSVDQIANEWGLSPSAYASAEAYFEGYGISVAHAWPDRLSLSLTGGASAFDRAFDTTLLSGEYHQRAVTYPETAPGLPSWLEPEVATVTGLSDGFTSFQLPLLPTVPSSGPSSTPPQPNLITPAVARQVYQISSLYNYTGSATFATSSTIVLLLWGEGYAPSDLTTFFANDYPSSFPTVRVTPYPIDGAPEPSAGAVNDPSMAPQELTLDLEWSGSMAPGASLDAVYAPDGPSSDQYSPSVASMTDALNQAVTGLTGVDAISMSFGTAEGSGGGLATAWANDIAEATHRQITLLGATGDTGGDAGTGCSGGLQPNYPAADPYVIAVGGTNPTLATNPLQGVTGLASESAWSGSGGGYSTEYAAPSWQLVGSAAAPISATGFRGMPDVAAAAATDYVYYDGSDRVGSGTSFATPLWAGLISEMDALHGGPLGFITPNLYSIGAAEPSGHLAEGLADITSGGNCLGPATVGWDTSTGWGSPRGEALYADLTATLVNLTLTASPLQVGPGAEVALTVRVVNGTSGAPLAGVLVLVTLTGDTDLGPCEGLFASGAPTTNATGFVVLTAAVPACYLGSKAVASAQVTSGGLYGFVQELIPVNLLGYLGFLGPLAVFPGDIALYVAIMGASIVIGVLLGRGPRRTPSNSRSPPPGAMAPSEPPSAPVPTSATLAAPSSPVPPPPDPSPDALPPALPPESAPAAPAADNP